jgi:hypothetical protein
MKGFKNLQKDSTLFIGVRKEVLTKATWMITKGMDLEHFTIYKGDIMRVTGKIIEWMDMEKSTMILEN